MLQGTAVVNSGTIIVPINVRSVTKWQYLQIK